jgi:hypothetical protein
MERRKTLISTQIRAARNGSLMGADGHSCLIRGLQILSIGLIFRPEIVEAGA